MAFAVALPGLLAAAGVASDYAIFNMKLAQLQSAADQAAIAGARELSLAPATARTVQSSAESFARATISSSRNVAVNVAADRTKLEVTVGLTETWAPFFAHFLGVQVTPINVTATATLAGRQSICILDLDTGASGSLAVEDGSAIKANGCGAFVNSAASESIRVASASSIKASEVCTVGGVRNGGSISPAPTTDCQPTEDPLADRSAPAFGACDFTSYKISKGTATLSPGVYCDGIDISGNAQVRFSPGVYVVKDGEFKIAGQAVVSGEHVGFYLAGDKSLIKFTNETTIGLTGAKDGVMAGLLFFEDRGATAGREHRISSSNAHTLTGTIYLSRGNLRIDSDPVGTTAATSASESSVGQSSAYTAIIAQNLLVRTGPKLVLNSDYDSTDVPVPQGVRATSQVVLSK